MMIKQAAINNSNKADKSDGAKGASTGMSAKRSGSMSSNMEVVSKLAAWLKSSKQQRPFSHCALACSLGVEWAYTSLWV
ncbi:conserved hypothetical protein [Ricinus communis]|uniref:Uncharacterized protein n=1 Tax=Ricinus communis TaxID=3988 RepID=B9SFX4_RICCO|nr:conserved hypothetical protein [Ricinus communis]